MKYKSVLLLSLLFCSCVKTETIAEYLPYSFKVNGLAYNIMSENNKTVVVTGAEKPSSYKGNIVIPSNVDFNNDTYTVTQIAYQAFYESQIVSLTIPNTINYIIDSAFEGSTLKDLTISDGNQSIAVNKSLNYAPIETAYIGSSITGDWISSSLNKLTLGKQVSNFSIQLNQPLEITVESEIPPTGKIEGSDDIFKESILYVPANAIDSYYESENWGKFEIILAKE